MIWWRAKLRDTHKGRRGARQGTQATNQQCSQYMIKCHYQVNATTMEWTNAKEAHTAWTELIMKRNGWITKVYLQQPYKTVKWRGKIYIKVEAEERNGNVLALVTRFSLSRLYKNLLIALVTVELNWLNVHGRGNIVERVMQGGNVESSGVWFVCYETSFAFGAFLVL